MKKIYLILFLLVAFAVLTCTSGVADNKTGSETDIITRDIAGTKTGNENISSRSLSPEAECPPGSYARNCGGCPCECECYNETIGKVVGYRSCKLGDVLVKDTTLTKDYTGTGWSYFDLDVDGITLDCNGHTLDGAGVRVSDNNRVTIKNCVIVNADYDGIYLYSSSNNNITGNTVSNNRNLGIYLDSSSNNNITDNIASNNIHGIHLSSSGNNVVTGNIANSNGQGIHLWSSSSNNVITGNTASNNIYCGISLYDSSNNVITGNFASDNGYNGIYLNSSNDNDITDNFASDNVWCGIILLSSSSKNVISDNTVSNGNDGIGLDSSSNNTLTGNTVSNNDQGIYLVSSSDYNTIYNNYFNNTNNAYDNGDNTWNITKTSGTNIVCGPYLGGNYWSDYEGEDLDGDKLGDTMLPYNSSWDIQNGGDYHPLIEIEKLLLEIPVQFKNVHPYKQSVIAPPSSSFAPVFQRGVEKPQFEIKSLTGVSSGYELKVVIEEPKGRGKYAVVKNLTISSGWEGDKVLSEWDYSTDSSKRDKKNIPIGVYKAQAQLVNKITQDVVQQSDIKDFYVIFDWDSTKKGFITSDNAYAFYNYPCFVGYGGVRYKLHIYDERIWKKSLTNLSNSRTVTFRNIDLTNRERVAKALGDMHFIDGYIRYPQVIDDYWPGKNNLWYDNIRALDAGTGTCTDQSALPIGFLRAVGIPARMVHATGKGGLSPNYKDLDHAFVEAWYSGNWHWFDPTNVPGIDAGTCGSNEYTREGVQFRPAGAKSYKYNGYWAITSSSVPGNTPPSNIYKRYNYNLDVVDLRFDKPSGYNPGDTMTIDIDVYNDRYLYFPEPSYLEIMIQSEVPTIIMLPEVKVADKIIPYDTITKTITATAPSDKKTIVGYFSKRIELIPQYIVVRPYTLYNGQRAYTTTSTYTKKIPGYSISSIYSIDVDGTEKTFQRFNGTFFETNLSDEKAYIKDGYVWDNLPVNIELYSEVNLGRNYSKTVVTVENQDSEPHEYNFSMPVYGFGDAAYVPAIGTITTSTTLNVEASHIIAYNQSSAEDNNVSVYELSKDAKIKAVEIFEHEGIKLIKADACWNITLTPGSSHEFTVYSSTRPANITAPSGFNFSEIHTTFAKEIVDNGDSLLNLRINAPTGVRVGGIIPINLAVSNTGIEEEMMNLSLNVSRTPLYSSTLGIIHTNTTTISVSPLNEKSLTYPVYIPQNTSIGIWDVNVGTDKGIGAKAAFAVEDAFDLNCTQNITIIQPSPFTFNVTITNTWDVPVHDVNVTINHFYSFNTSESVGKDIGTLLPGESRTISWQLNATSSGKLPIEVLVTSDDGGYDTISTTITSLSPPVLWIPNVITHTSTPDFGTSKTVSMNVTIQNLGDFTANNVQVQLILPENVTSTALTHDIGDLLGGEQKNVSIGITFSTRKDFAFDVIAKDDANHSAISAIMVLQYGLFVDVFDTGEGTYPSIFGTHKGTIKPCGHTEYVWVYGNDVNESSSWDGYSGDWHNITFSEPFTLETGKTYNYTIRTGSYPQIIHIQNHTTLDGSLITCEEFIDANGKKYDGWIPAIKLF
jgi:parallel beta-helix repeat protein